MKISCTFLFSVATFGFVALSSAAFVNEDFDDGAIDTFYTPIGDTSFVSDLGSSTSGPGALRLVNGVPQQPIFGGGANNLSPELESIATTLGSTFGLEFSDLAAQFTPYLSNFMGATNVNMLHTEIFDVSVESLLQFDYFVGAPRDNSGRGTGDSTFNEFSFYYLTNGDELTFSIFGESSFVFNTGALGREVLLGANNKNLLPGEEYFFALGAVYGNENYGVLGEDNYYFLDVDNIMVSPISQNPPGLPTPVPEPSTYGLIGGGFLAAMIAYRRFKAKKALAA